MYLNKMRKNHSQWIRTLGACWGYTGFFLLMLFAIVRLAGVSVDAMLYEIKAWHWLLLIANTLFMAYSEGYKGFQKNYSPRLAARALYLSKHGSTKQLLLAPAFCMSFFDAPRKRIIISYSILGMVIVLVTLFRFLPQPIRGILDFGVVVGLSWGVISVVYFAYCYAFGSLIAVDGEVEEEVASN